MRDKAKFISPVRPERKHCPECAFYLDDVIETHDRISKKDMVSDKGFDFDIIMDKMFPIAEKDAAQRMMYMPGFQFRKYTTGTLYDRIGFTIPCGCQSGLQVHEGFREKGDGKKYNHNVCRMDATYHRLQYEPILTLEIQ